MPNHTEYAFAAAIEHGLATAAVTGLIEGLR